MTSGPWPRLADDEDEGMEWESPDEDRDPFEIYDVVQVWDPEAGEWVDAGADPSPPTDRHPLDRHDDDPF